MKTVLLGIVEGLLFMTVAVVSAGFLTIMWALAQ